MKFGMFFYLLGCAFVFKPSFSAMYVQNKSSNVRGVFIQEGEDFIFRSCKGADFNPTTNPEVCSKAESVDFKFSDLDLSEKQYKGIGLKTIETEMGGLQVDPSRLTDINYLNLIVDTGGKTLFVLHRVMDIVYNHTQFLLNNDPLCNNEMAFAAGLAGVGDLVLEACRSSTGAALNGIKQFAHLGQKHYFLQIETGLLVYFKHGQNAIQSPQLYNMISVESEAYLELSKYDIEPYVLNKYFKKSNKTMQQCFVDIMTKG